MSLEELFEEESGNITQSEESLSKLSSLVADMKEYQREVEAAEEQLKIAQDALKNVQEKLIPDLMDEIGVTEFTTKDGTKLSVVSKYIPKINKSNENLWFSFLESQGLDVVKEEIKLKFQKGDESAQELKGILEGSGFTYESKRGVHPSTMKSVVKDLVSQGTLPAEGLDIFTINQAKLK